MLFHSFSPATFCISTMIPIPKGFNKDLSKTVNYRGIALSSLFSKIFDNCIISSQGAALLSDELQFAYKSGMSTVQCVSVITETINYYLHNDSNVYMCTIDASKAFDRVNLYVLFTKLYRRKFCPLYLRFLFNSYCGQNMMVRWNGALSNSFNTSNGVKQGGVLSPLLFSVYLDDLLHQLRELNIGCHMNGHFVGAIIYADDITLLGPTRSSVVSLLDVCAEYATKHDILFNPSKTTCMYFSPYPSSLPGKMLSFMNADVSYVSNCTFLGMSISDNDVTDRYIQKSAQRFYRKANEVLSDFKSLTRDTKSKLLSSYCLDAYGSQLWPFFDKSVCQFFTAWRKTIRKLWCLPHTTHCRFLHTINNSLPIDIALEKRCLKFLWSCMNSNNDIVKSVSLSSMGNSYSTFGENYRYLSHKYNICPYAWNKPFYCVVNKLYTFVDRLPVCQEAIMIRDLCIEYDDGFFDILDSEQMCHLIEYLCTI